MRTNLYFELCTQVQDSRVLSLLLFPGPPLIAAGGKLTLKRHSQARCRAVRVKSISAFIQAASNDKLNSVDALYTFAGCMPDQRGISVCEILQELVISPTNSIWFTPSELPDDRGPIVDRVAMTLQSQEDYLKYNDIRRKPTRLRNILTVEITAVSEQILDDFAELVADSLPDDIFGLDIFGEGGFHATENLLRTYDSITVIRNWPGTYPLLGERFGLLQSIMLGPLPSCEGLAHALGSGITLREIHSADGSRHLGMLRVPGDTLKDPESAARAKPWLVPRDESTARKLSPYELRERDNATRKSPIR